MTKYSKTALVAMLALPAFTSFAKADEISYQESGADNQTTIIQGVADQDSARTAFNDLLIGRLADTFGEVFTSTEEEGKHSPAAAALANAASQAAFNRESLAVTGGNSISIESIGSSNVNSMAQSGQKNRLSLEQDGVTNTFTALQSAVEAELTVAQDGSENDLVTVQMGTGVTFGASLTQSGDNNTIATVQNNTAGLTGVSKLEVLQQGDHNAANIQIDGTTTDDGIVVEQVGSSLIASLALIGTDNSASITQYADNASINFAIEGDGNTVSTRQDADAKIELELNGSSNAFTISQSGNAINALASLAISGDDNKVLLAQSAANVFTDISISAASDGNMVDLSQSSSGAEATISIDGQENYALLANHDSAIVTIDTLGNSTHMHIKQF